MPLPDFDPDAWSLAEHGDSRQRRHATRLAVAWPHYEELWRRHVLPLTFRPHQPDNYFLRPTQKRPLVALADASYAAFFHYAGMVEWRDQLPHARRPEAIRASECLYCYFSHVSSLFDAVLHFARAVNDVLLEYRQPTAFGVLESEDGQPYGLSTQQARAAAGLWHELRRELAPYRNFLVHQQPVLLQNNLLPKVGSMREFSGLTAISKQALSKQDPRLHHEPALEMLEETTEHLAGMLDRVWQEALEALDRIDQPRYREDQLKLRPDDAPLTLERIHAARGN